MKYIKLVVAFLALAASPTASYAMAMTQDIRFIIYFLDDSYQVVGKYTSYCDNTSTMEGEWTYRHTDESFDCPE